MIIDTLSFSTAVVTALGTGARIRPCARADEAPPSPVLHAETPIRFERVVGQPRTECYSRRSIDP